MKSLAEIRSDVELCRNADNTGCITLIKYRNEANVEGASHPVLFQTVPKSKIMLIGAVPGSIDADARKAVYQKLVNAQFALGHKSAMGLGEIMMRAGKIKGIDLPADITRLPDTKRIQDKHLLARERLGLHVTNLVKCHAPTSWESTDTTLWKLASNACERRHLVNEVKATDPSMIILLGKEVIEYVSETESWAPQVNKLKISKWAYHARHLPFYGKDRFVSAWIHPGGRYFWIQGKRHWDLYAEQMAEFLD